MVEFSDIELVLRASSGDKNAFGLFVGRHYDLIYRVAYKWSGVKEDAEDITQEVLVKLARSLDTFKNESDVRTWLYRITVNTAKDFHRKNSVKKKYEGVFAEESSSVGSAADAVREGSADKEVVMAALDKLSGKLKDALLLVVGEDLSHAEAAEVLGCATATVAWRVFQAKRKLQVMLKREVEA